MKKLINIAQVIWNVTCGEHCLIHQQKICTQPDQMLLFNGMVCPINVSPNAVVISINDNSGFVFEEYVVK